VSLHTRDRIWIKKRKGFLKYALQHGYSLSPAYVFGERATFINLQGFWKFRHWLNKYGIPGVFPFGKWWCPLLPRDGSLHIVVGRPLHLPKIESPTDSEINEHHLRYIKHVEELFERHKANYYTGINKTAPLEIW